MTGSEKTKLQGKPEFYLFPRKKHWLRYTAALAMVSHIIGASWVLYSLSLGGNNWVESLKFGRKLLNLKDPNYDHDEHTILHVWMCALQFRYIITDSYAVYQAFVNRRLLFTSVSTHLLEGFVCSLFFIGHSTLTESKDCFVFGFTCIVWTLVWFGAYVAMNVEKMKDKISRARQRLKRMRRAARFSTKSDLFGSFSDTEPNMFKRRLKKSFDSLNNLVKFQSTDGEGDSSEESDRFVHKMVRRRRQQKRSTS